MATPKTTPATRFFLVIEGDARRPFGSVDEAISYARPRLYLGPADEARVRNELEHGHPAEWRYGFKSAQITPAEEP